MVMDSVQETPLKRRKMQTGYVTNGQAYDSQGDSVDDFFNDFETIATIPIRRSLPKRTSPDLLSSPAAHVTQPTQIIRRETPGLDSSGRKPSVVQVAASSPARMAALCSPRTTAVNEYSGKLACAMAPAGTAFRPPLGVTKPPIIDLSDDEGPTYRGDSSDDELQRGLRADIKPSTFIQSAQRLSSGNAAKNRPSDTANGAARFQEITSGAFYKPFNSNKAKGQGSTLSGSVYDSRNRDESHTSSRFTASSKRSADIMANAYGGSSRPARQVRPSQAGPAKAQLVNEMTLDDIGDYQLRSKIEGMQRILPQHSVQACKSALMAKKGNYDDALELLTMQETLPQEIDLTVSDNDQSTSQPAKQKKILAKQQIKAPVQSIQERWTATQTISKPTHPLVSSPTVPKPRRRLVQGRKRQPSPLHTKPSSTPSTRTLTPDSDDSDSGLGAESDRDAEIETKVLSFLNTCSTPDLVDIAAISDDLATMLLSQKPFRSLDEARQATDVSNAGTKRKAKKPIGEKIVDKCIDMWTGYEAVDTLVRQCEALGKPVADEMKKWGVDVFGVAKDSELEIVSFDKIPGDIQSEGSIQDSGIGTPNSVELSAEETVSTEAKALLEQGRKVFFPQPEIMGEGVVLKDYQVVGVNWLYLLFQKNLSCILADDMGLGKTCQVIAFLAHLLEKGIKGPHLVVVPGSTLENWLREFSIFCPGLTVMPYYGELSLV